MPRPHLERSRRRQRLVTAAALVATVAAASFGVTALFAPASERTTVADLFLPSPAPRPVDDDDRLSLTGRGGNLRLPLVEDTPDASDTSTSTDAPPPESAAPTTPETPAPRSSRKPTTAPTPAPTSTPSEDTPPSTDPAQAPDDKHEPAGDTQPAPTTPPPGRPTTVPTPAPTSAPPSTTPPTKRPSPTTPPSPTAPPATAPPSTTPPTTTPPTGTQPDASTTGVPAGTKLKVHEGDLTITQKGAVVDGMDVRGAIRVQASDVTIKNTVVRGRPVSSILHLVQIASGAQGTRIVDTEIFAAHPSPYVMGVVGAGFTLERVNIHTVIDQVTVIGNGVTVKDSWLHDNLFYANDPNHGGGPSHDDNIQVQIGSQLHVTGSRLEGSRSAAVMITQGSGAVSDALIESSWIDGGACSINIAQHRFGPLRGVTVRNNVFGTSTGHAYCALLVPSTTTVAQTGNSFVDGTAFRISKG